MDYFYFKQGGRHRWISPHSMLVMKITTFLLLIGCLHANADIYGQKVTLSERNVSLERIISLLKQQTGYDFLYGTDLRADVKKVDIEAQNQELVTVLQSLFSNLPFSYAISDNTIVISSKTDGVVQQRTVQGKVLDENRKPLQSATVSVEGINQSTQTDVFGMFTLTNVPADATIRIRFMGYDTRTIKITTGKEFMEIIMRMSENQLQEASVLSTGYYTLPKERATGSFEYVDNKLFNRNVGPDVISRLNGVTASTIFGPVSAMPSLLLNQNASPGVRKINALDNLQIRGMSTLTLHTPFDAGTPGRLPLVIVDNFVYEGDINNINPNDVENVTVLKDAAAASIWGSRSANGVIVITTKKGKIDQPLRISLNSNLTVTKKPDLFYGPAMSSSDFIDFEKFNFERGTFDWFVDDPNAWYMTVTPVMALLAKQRSLSLTDVSGRAAIDKQIDSYRNNDIRKDISKYLYRNAVLQQYSANISGGGRQFSYFLSGGYDHNISNDVQVYYQRKNLRSNLAFKPTRNLELVADIRYNNGLYHEPSNLLRGGRIISKVNRDIPYQRLADDQGNPVELELAPSSFVLLHSYKMAAGNGRLLDWRYFPLNDINRNYGESNTQEIMTNFGMNYRVIPSILASISYQYTNSSDQFTQFQGRDSYTVRDYINSFALYSTSDLTAPANFQVPIGDVMGKGIIPRLSNIIRGHLNFDQTFNKKHEINAIVGGERTEAKVNGGPYVSQIFGYNADPMSLGAFDFYGKPILALNGEAGENIVPNPYLLQTSYINRTTSIFANASYSYNRRYIITVSGRNDAANIYGIKASDRIKPNWSIGGAWNIHEEAFFKPMFFQILKLRATYGYMGNVNNSFSAYPTINYVSEVNTITRQPYANLGNGPNSHLSPERSGMLNLGIDFTLRNNRISGTFEWYKKRSIDLIAATPLDISSGFESLNMNSASMTTKGVDLTLQSINLQSQNFRWQTNFIFSHTRNTVTKYLLPNYPENSVYYVPFATATQRPFLYREGYSPFSLYTYRYAGLDPQTGDPMGYDKNGNVTKNYNDILNLEFKDLENHGSIIPLYYGAFRNTWQWKSLSLSLNILYKFKYKLYRPGYSNDVALFAYQTGVLPEYAKRWQKPGDEKRIDVIPSIVPMSSDLSRSQFYSASSARVISGDHIRLQDIRIDYNIPTKGKVLHSLQIYSVINNVGILWRANRFGIDPETLAQPPIPRQITVGFTAGF